MTMADVLSLTLLVIAAVTDPEALVRRLGAPTYAERQEAEAALEGLGQAALPAIRAAARESNDPEVRMRAAHLVAKIENGLVMKSTMMRLDFRDRPLAEIVKEIGGQVGGALSLVEGNMGRGGAAGPPRSVTLVEPDPVPFWEAIDRLCRENDLHYVVPQSAGPSGAQGASFQIGVGAGIPGPTSDDGPFRVSLEAIEHHRVRPLARRVP